LHGPQPLPLGAILLVRIPATFLAGEYVGGFAAMVAFGAAWLVLASLLIFERVRAGPSANNSAEFTPGGQLNYIFEFSGLNYA
jgi:hypothetical protein